MDAETGQREDRGDILQADLAMYVTDDNERFQQEITDWDKEQRRRASNVGPGGDGTSRWMPGQCLLRMCQSFWRGVGGR